MHKDLGLFADWAISWVWRWETAAAREVYNYV